MYAYGRDNEYIGQSENHVVKKADDYSFTIDQNSAGYQAGYISVANDNDGTCIAWITVRQHDDTETGGAWTGDIGKECGQRWYPSNQLAGKVTDENGEKVDYAPACETLTAPPILRKITDTQVGTWIDKNFTDGACEAIIMRTLSLMLTGMY